MEAPKKWESLGWVEAQVFAKQTWQRDVQPTCKRKTVKDFIYPSPELLPFVRSVHTDDSYFADHALLWVELASLGLPQPLPIWRMPRPLPVHLKVPATQEVPCDADTTAQYRAIWQSFERRVEAIQAAKQEPVAPTQLGRAQTTEVCWITTELAPPTKGSSNATKPTFDGRNLTHARWLRQVRRLDSLSHLYESPKPWESIVADATAVWHSILASPGFPPRFATWISHRIDAYAKAELQESPQELYSLRSHLPSAQGLQKLRAAMLLELRHLEQTLLADRLQLAKANRRDNPARIFGDLRPERHESVSTVVAPAKATVIEIRPDTMEITFEPSDAFDHSAPLFCDGRMLELTALGEGVATLQHSLPEAGATVTQDRLHADPTEVFRAFEAEWEKRWDRHRHYSDERWQPFIDWYQAHVPAATSQMPLPAITLSEWKSAVRGKKSRSATGSDGISKHDLLALADDLTQSLLDLIRAVELGESWPDAAMQAMVTAIAKTPSAATTSQYRPITVISLVYRVWATIRARQLIRWLVQFVPSTLVGNMPGRTTASIWYALQEEIECALANGDDLVGMATDVVKCYNTLPRKPVFGLACHLGVGPTLLLPWHRCLVQLNRRFRVGNAVSPGLRSTTGFAEGDPLSVCSMILINIAAHYWLQEQAPEVRFVNYVDNLETVGNDTAAVKQSFRSLQDFCTALDIELDAKKTLYWALTAQSRKDLKASGLHVVLAARDLGVTWPTVLGAPIAR